MTQILCFHKELDQKDAKSKQNLHFIRHNVLFGEDFHLCQWGRFLLKNPKSKE